MKKRMFLCCLIALCLAFGFADAGGWTVPDNHHSPGNTNNNYYSGYEGISVEAYEDLATRSGPSTTYTGGGTYRLKGQKVKALAFSYDNGGVLWIEVEISYGGGYRRVWTGAKRLSIAKKHLSQLPEEDFSSWIGYGTVNKTIAPRFGPGNIYSTYGDRNYHQNDQVAVIRMENDYYLVESYHTDGKILRCWLPDDCVDLN